MALLPDLSRAILILTLLTPLTLLAGCGKKGALVPPEALAPAPVSNLAVSQQGDRFQVSWSPPTREEAGAPLKDLAGFLLFRRVLLPPAEDCEECPSAYAERARIDLAYPQGIRRSGSLILFDDSDLKTGQSYQYKVRAFTFDGVQSRDSNKARHSALPPPPAPLLEALSSSTGVVLAFVAPPPGQGTLLGYNIYRGKKGGEAPLSPLNPAPVTGNTYEDKEVAVGVRYSYRVTSVAALNGESAESAPSNPAEGAMLERD